MIYDCLSRSRHRYTLHRLKETEKPVPLADLAEDIADWETETAKDEIADETVKEVYMLLYHNHIPKLTDADLIQYNQKRDTVELSEYPEELSNNGQFVAAEQFQAPGVQFAYVENSWTSNSPLKSSLPTAQYTLCIGSVTIQLYACFMKVFLPTQLASSYHAA